MSPKASISSYKDWTFEINQKLTQCIYTNMLCGKSGSATDPMYQSFIQYREKFFPSEVLNFFDEIGIDFTKEYQITYKVNENGQICFDGNFQFIGNLVRGESCKIEIGKDYALYELHAVTENFSIGFHQDETPFFNQHIIHVEFSLSLPNRVKAAAC